jgi:hypothetical protein
MIKVRKLLKTSDDRPTQWEGLVGDTGSFYARYRHGELEAYVAEASLDPVKDGVVIFSKKMGGRYDGAMENDQMRRALAGVVHFIDFIDFID